MKKFLVTVLLLVSALVAPPAKAAEPNIVINELQCSGTDWIELYNPTNVTVNLSQWIITDRNPADGYPTGKHLFVFNTGSVLKAKSFRVIKEGSTSSNMKFGIDCTRQETIYLGYGTGVLWTEIDRINPPAFHAGASYGRLVDGGATWGHTLPTEKAANQSLMPALSSASSFTCKLKLKCTLKLTATRNGTFALTSAKTGVTLSSSGTMTITARKKKQTLTLPISITNQYGTVEKTITVKIG